MEKIVVKAELILTPQVEDELTVKQRCEIALAAEVAINTIGAVYIEPLNMPRLGIGFRLHIKD